MTERVAPARYTRLLLALCPRSLIALAMIALATVLGCEPASPTGPDVGSNSNWLKACTADPQCGDQPACRCGACTTECVRDEDCGELPDARCVQQRDPAAQAQCQTAQPALTKGVCLPRCAPGDCQDGQACIDGTCVHAIVPDNAFCQPIAQRSESDRKAEQELLEALQSLRVQGGTMCGAAAAAPAAPGLRFDTRLLCAARVLAAELQTTHATTIIDGEGRGSDERMALAGYDARQWFEAFAVLAPSVDAALEIMLGEPNACGAFFDPMFADIGVASSGDAFVVTLGRE